jgi:transposase
MAVKQASAKTLISAIGLDLGDRRSRVCVVDHEGEVIDEGSIDTTQDAIERRFGGLDPCRIVLETGTHANWVHDLLVKLGHEVIVANARKVRAISANERKCDELDARMLARLGRADPRLLHAVRVRSEQARLDLVMVRARAELVELRTSLANSLRGLAKSSGHRLAKCSPQCLHKQPLHPELEPGLRHVMDVLEAVSKAISQYDKLLGAVAHKRYPQCALLRQVVGVGPVSALHFVLTVDDPRRFADPRDIGAYFGLVPRRDQSGARDPELGISKAGERMGRTLLVQCAHHILGRFGKDSDLRRFGKRLEASGGTRAKKRAVVATARKLAVLLLALLRSGEAYEPLRNSTPVLVS